MAEFVYWNHWVWKAGKHHDWLLHADVNGSLLTAYPVSVLTHKCQLHVQAANHGTVALTTELAVLCNV